MAKEGNSLFNGIIIALVTVLFSALVPAVRDWAVTVFAAVWSALSQGWTLIVNSYPVPGWLILVALLLACRAAYGLYKRAQRPSPITWQNSYIEDRMHSVVWRWRYVGGSIDDLLAFCPQCDAQLVYEERGPDIRRRLWDDRPNTTILHCETCSVPRATLEGDHRYAWARVEREIQRRIRTGDWRQQLKSEDVPVS